MSELHEAQERNVAPVPRITIQAFCETADVSEIIESTSDDRRMLKAHLKVQMGGAGAAVEAYRHAPTPNVVIVETQMRARAEALTQLDGLAQVCDAGTKVIVVGHVNDVILYRDLMRRGVSEYLIAPIEPLALIGAISDLFAAPGSDPVGRTIAVVGAKGGVGASTIAHNLSWTISRNLATATVIADLDIAFGTASLNFNQDPPQGIAEAVFAPERLDANLVDRLLSKCSDKLSLLAAPAALERSIDLGELAFDGIVDILRQTVPCVVLDVPHLWPAWAKRVLISADEIVIVAGPELASLRNAKNLCEILRQARPNDRRPRIVLNQVGMPKRAEIGAAEFGKALETTVTASIPFEPALFGAAANNGQMISEVQATGKVAEILAEVARQLTGRVEPRRSRAAFLEPLKARLARRKAS